MSPAWVLVLYGVFFALVFGVRTAVQLRRTGRTGFHGISGARFSLEWWGGVLFVGAIAVGLAAPLLSAFELIPTPSLPPALTGVGVGLYVLGLGGTFAAQVGMGTSWRIGVDASERTALVVDGLFRAVRNPIFSFIVVASLGFALLVPNPLAWVGLALLVAALQLQVRFVEEPYLLRTHGPAYSAYAAQVGRFVPFLGRLPPGGSVGPG